MQPINFMPQALSRTSSQQPEKLQAGQIIHGKINKIYPNQTAEVQIGNQKIMASLDAPLKAGERYWLQVQPGGGRLQLKVLHGSDKAAEGGIKGAAIQLLAHLAVPQNRESVELANYLLRNQLPVTKDSFVMSLGWLKTSDNLGGALAGIKTMHTMNVPFIDEVFHALQSLENGGTFHEAASKLLGQINERGSNSETLQNVKSLLEKITVPKQFHISSYPVEKLISSWLSTEISPDAKKSAFAILQKAGFFPLDNSEEGTIEKMAANFQNGKNQLPDALKDGLSLIMHYNAAKQSGNPAAGRILELFNRLLKNPADVKTASIQSFSVNTLNAFSSDPNINRGLNQTRVFSGQESVQLIKQLLQALFVKEGDGGQADRQSLTPGQLLSASGGGKDGFGQIHNKLAAMMAGEEETEAGPSRLDTMERQLLMDILAEGDKPPDFTKGKTFAGFLKEMAKMLGVNLEHFLANAGRMETGIPEEHLQTLKPMLMKLLAENQHSSIKESAEQILNRITAQQLLSQDSGPIQNIFMQIPFAISGFQTDLTLQWSGRKKSDGTIDPNFCRVLFYLDLEQMQQTVIDLQIQNRVIKVSVINENHALLEKLSQPFYKTLKTNLEDMDYKLSTVVFESEATVDAKRASLAEGHGRAVRAGNKPYSGVDIRI
ncbi:hypothetical protein [Peribacillus glennii]|uniref:Flagellar hook-length control protein FliK n=1 Tax=Peribacillus glennii TaxID=2303991 RepID=A0A372LC68_9BACI|nr:hypothetical protein [Peribacillus glennii]RFU63298.1 hypothetical protein D0466_11180 [Peribacillus glennii]